MPWGGGHPEAILAKLLWLQAMMLLSAKEAAHLPSEEFELLLASPLSLSPELLEQACWFCSNS